MEVTEIYSTAGRLHFFYKTKNYFVKPRFNPQHTNSPLSHPLSDMSIKLNQQNYNTSVWKGENTCS